MASVGVEPTANGLRIRCSAFELRGRREREFRVLRSGFCVLASVLGVLVSHLNPHLRTQNSELGTQDSAPNGPRGVRTHNRRLRNPLLFLLSYEAAMDRVGNDPTTSRSALLSAPHRVLYQLSCRPGQCAVPESNRHHLFGRQALCRLS